MQIPGAGCSQPFNFLKGGKQGAVETPDIFNAMVETCLEPLVHSWVSRGFGFQLDSHFVSHLIWCDNIFLFASQQDQLRQMTAELTDAIVQYGFTWKPSSLMCMAAGSAVGQVMDLTASCQGTGRRVSSHIRQTPSQVNQYLGWNRAGSSRDGSSRLSGNGGGDVKGMRHSNLLYPLTLGALPVIAVK